MFQISSVLFFGLWWRQVRRQVQEFDVVITSGGVGPTHDDITIYSVARALNQSVRENKVCVWCNIYMVCMRCNCPIVRVWVLSSHPALF